jgi:hypothetical protein
MNINLEAVGGGKVEDRPIYRPTGASGVAPPAGVSNLPACRSTPSRTRPRSGSFAVGSRSEDGGLQAVASQLFLRIRKSHSSEIETIRTIASKPGMPEEGVIRKWARDGGWEKCYDQQRALATLSDEEFKNDYRLQRLRMQLRNAAEVLNNAYSKVTRTDDEGNALSISTDVETYGKAYKIWKDALDSLWEAEQQLRRSLESRSTADSATRKDVIVNELLAEYGDYGPQYRHLISLVAGITLRIEAMEVGGRDAPSAEYVQLAKLKLDAINQMQKYTEATKSATVSQELNSLGAKFLEIAERRFGTYPDEFAAFIEDIKTAIREKEAA